MSQGLNGHFDTLGYALRPGGDPSWGSKGNSSDLKRRTRPLRTSGAPQPRLDFRASDYLRNTRCLADGRRSQRVTPAVNFRDIECRRNEQEQRSAVAPETSFDLVRRRRIQAITTPTTMPLPHELEHAIPHRLAWREIIGIRPLSQAHGSNSPSASESRCAYS